MSQNQQENGANPEIRTTKGVGGRGWFGTVWVDGTAVFSVAGYDTEIELVARLDRFIAAYERRARYRRNGTGRRGEWPAFTGGKARP